MNDKICSHFHAGRIIKTFASNVFDVRDDVLTPVVTMASIAVFQITDENDTNGTSLNTMKKAT